ncbi:MAG: peptidoglycan DD-metalloendopeptidase family protein [Bacteroidota bacterium]|nr:peptidoglycan DD-metalloendopeptidase family protein [Bacteroidota bacterium]
MSLFSYSPIDDIKKKQSQLEKLRKEIETYDKKINESEKKERATLDLLTIYDRQSVLIKKLIKNLHERETTLKKDIDETKRTINELGGQLRYLKNHYANYVTTIYKNGRTYDLELLLAAKSFNQLLVRSEYLKRFSSQRKEDLNKIDTKRSSYEEQNILLQKQLAEQRLLIDEKQKEEKRLTGKLKERKKLLADIRKNKKNYQREIERRKQDARELEQIITKLIEEDRKKHEKLSKKEDELVEPGVGFAAKRGRLRWPVANGKLASRFGLQKHPTLGTTTQNTGIDIVVPMGTDVHVVADGEISKIHWLPSFGNLIIVNHKNGFRTVYAHLSEIFVNEGDKVNEGNRLGKSGDSISGSVLHFEIYKDREKLDPELWLRKQSLSQR